ncbi:hypothetical protein [Anaplasma platys]|nr:hypothetical protein [Anaplasma platys]
MEIGGVRKTRENELQIVLSLVILAVAIKSLVAVAMYWHGVLAASTVTASQFAIGMALSLAVVIAFAGLVAFACMKHKDVARTAAVRRARSAGLSESELLKLGLYTDPWSKEGNLRVALSTALGGLVASSLIGLGMFWHNVAIAASTVTAIHWIAGVALAVAVVVSLASLVLLAQGQCQELPSHDASPNVRDQHLHTREERNSAERAVNDPNALPSSLSAAATNEEWETLPGTQTPNYSCLGTLAAKPAAIIVTAPDAELCYSAPQPQVG